MKKLHELITKSYGSVMLRINPHTDYDCSVDEYFLNFADGHEQIDEHVMHDMKSSDTIVELEFTHRPCTCSIVIYHNDIYQAIQIALSKF